MLIRATPYHPTYHLRNLLKYATHPLIVSMPGSVDKNLNVSTLEYRLESEWSRNEFNLATNFYSPITFAFPSTSASVQRRTQLSPVISTQTNCLDNICFSSGLAKLKLCLTFSIQFGYVLSLVITDGARWETNIVSLLFVLTSTLLFVAAI